MTNSNLATTPPPRDYDRTGDEIDLLELGEQLWGLKRVVLGTMMAALLLAALYLLFAEPVFESTTRLRPPLVSQLAGINETGQLELTPEVAFNRVVFEARSVNAQREVFAAFSDRLLAHEALSEEQSEWYFRRKFVPSISVDIGGLARDDVLAETTMAITFQHVDNRLAAEIANALARSAQARALTGVLDDLYVPLETKIRLLESRVIQGATTLKQSDENEIVRLREEDELRKRNLQDQIEALKGKAYSLRLDRISELEEALSIAQRLDIREPVTRRMLSRDEGSGESIALTADISNGSQDPLYLLGSRMLEAEVVALRERASDAHTVPKLRELQMQLELLKNNRRIEVLQAREDYIAFADNASLRAEISQLRELRNASYDNVQLARNDQLAVASETPKGYGRLYVLGTAMVVGILFGTLGALIMIALENRRTRNSQQAAADGEN